MSDGVTIEPGGTSDALAGQLDALRTEGRAAMKHATTITADHVRELTRGRIAEHIEDTVTASAGTVTGNVFPARDIRDIAKWVDEGTGLYIEFHHPIRPAPARTATNPRAALQIAPGVFRRQVKGQRPQRFIERALAAVEPQVEELLTAPADEVTRGLAR